MASATGITGAADDWRSIANVGGRQLVACVAMGGLCGSGRSVRPGGVGDEILSCGDGTEVGVTVDRFGSVAEVCGGNVGPATTSRPPGNS